MRLYSARGAARVAGLFFTVLLFAALLLTALFFAELLAVLLPALLFRGAPFFAGRFAVRLGVFVVGMPRPSARNVPPHALEPG